MKTTLLRSVLLAGGLLSALAGCTTLGGPRSVSAPMPSQWFAPLPHQGTLTDLTQWWQQQGDPLLVELIASAQAVSPSIASAR